MPVEAGHGTPGCGDPQGTELFAGLDRQRPLLARARRNRIVDSFRLSARPRLELGRCRRPRIAGRLLIRVSEPHRRLLPRRRARRSRNCVPPPWPDRAAGRRPGTSRHSRGVGPQVAMPTLTVTCAAPSSLAAISRRIRSPSASAGRRRQAVADHHELLAAEAEHQIGGAHRGHDRRARCGCSTSSPAAWPKRSLKLLKWSMSMSSRLTGRPAASAILDRAAALRLQPAAVERAGERIAAGARQQILVALAVGQRVENVGDARRAAAPPQRPLQPAQIDASRARYRATPRPSWRPSRRPAPHAGAR